MSKPLYRISWSTQEVETATLLDEHNMNEGASRETWLCKDSNGREFTCTKGMYKLSELEAWQEYEKELDATCKYEAAEISKLEIQYEQTMNAHMKVRKMISSLTAED
jgi:hypothetical protein